MHGTVAVQTERTELPKFSAILLTTNVLTKACTCTQSHVFTHALFERKQNQQYDQSRQY